MLILLILGDQKFETHNSLKNRNLLKNITMVSNLSPFCNCKEAL